MKLLDIFEATDEIDSSVQNQCFNCGASLENPYETKCKMCGFDSKEMFSCPYKIIKSIKTNNSIIDLGFCELSKQQCKVESLDFEVCPKFRSLDSI